MRKESQKSGKESEISFPQKAFLFLFFDKSVSDFGISLCLFLDKLT